MAAAVAVGLVNVAHWALPGVGANWKRTTGQAILRLLALVFTAAFIATTCYLVLDLFAWQAAQRSQLWSWLHWYQDWSVGPRMALAAGLVLAVIGGLWWLSRRTQGAYEARKSGFRAPNDPQWLLSSSTMWAGERPVARQRSAHLIVCGAVLLFVLTLPHVSSATSYWRTVLLIAAGVLGGAAVLMVLAPWTDRLSKAGAKNGVLDKAAAGLSWGSVALAATIAVVRVWWQPIDAHATAIPYDDRLQVVLLYTSLGVVAALSIVVLIQAPWGQPRRDVMGYGFAAAGVALLGTLIAEIFGAILLLSVSNLLAKPRVAPSATPTASDPSAGNLLYLPSTVYASGVAFLVAVFSALVVGGVLYLVVSAVIAKRLRTGSAVGDLATVYRDRGAKQAGADAAARKNVATTWARSRLTDYAALLLFAVTLPTFVALVVDEALLLSKERIAVLTAAASLGTSLGVLATGAFIAYLRSAVKNAGARKRFGFFWDVMTFWPRACHPFGPPCYAERSVPEVVTRIRRIVGDVHDGPGDPAVAQQLAEQYDAHPGPKYLEQHTPVLLVGYSQGCPIATAVVAQLPDSVRAQVALLTLASPARRLYGRAFPSYFGTEQLALLEGKLTDADAVRWVNLVRRSDYIGGWARTRDYPGNPGGVDREIYDPPVLWTNANPSPPPTHRHSDWFPDPQTRPAANELADLLTTDVPPSEPDLELAGGPGST